MSGKRLEVNDAFVPARREGVEAVEVVSRWRPRRFVLVHPDNGNLASLDVREHFLWERMDGARTLAALKQDYYNKFKALPTERLTQCVHRWLREGFLAAQPDEPEAQAGTAGRLVWAVQVPAAGLRDTLGALFQPLSTVPALAAMAAGAIGCLGFAMAGGGPGALVRAFSPDLPMSRVLPGLAASFYLFAVLRALLLLGALRRAPRFRWDKVQVGLACLVPFLRTSDRGLLLKNWEGRLACHLSALVLPLLVSGLALAALQAAPAGIPPALASALSVLGLAGLLDLLVQSCPLWDGLLSRVLGDLVGPRVSIRNLGARYLRDMRQNLEERPREESRVVLVYFACLFAWVIAGGSCLLLSTSTVAEGLLGEWSGHLQGAPLLRQAVQAALYGPMLAAFVLLFWKMLQPVVRGTVQHERWRDPAFLASTLGLSGLAAGLLLFLLPPLPSRAVFLLGIGLALLHDFRDLSRRPPWLKVHPFLVLLSATVAAAGVLDPSWRFLALPLACAWTAWLGFAVAHLLPGPAGWRALAYGSGAGFAVLFALPLVFLDAAADPVVSLVLPAGLFAGLFACTLGGGCGAHFSQGALGSLLLFSGFAQLGRLNIAEPLLMAGVFLLEFQALGLLATLRQKLADSGAHLRPEGKDARERITATLEGLASSCWGAAAARAFRRTLPPDFRYLRSWEAWLRAWLTETELSGAFRLAFSAAPWAERKDLGERLPVLNLARLEEKGGLSPGQRLGLLHGQLCFRRLDPQDLQDMADRLAPVSYAKGETIVRQGERGRPWLEIIASGRARMSAEAAEGAGEDFLAELAAGDAVRAKDLFKGGAYAFTVRAETEVLALRLHHGHMGAWCKAHPGLLPVVEESVELADTIAHLSLFRDFSAARIRLLMGRLKRREASAGEEVIRQGDQGDNFYILHDGEVEVLIDGRRVATLPAGSYFGEIALVQKCTRTATVRCTRTSVLYSLDQQDFDHFFGQGRGAQVLKNVSDRRVEANRAV